MKKQFPFQDPSRPLEERVDDLIGRMTLREKVSQMVHDAPAIERLGIPAYNWWNECLHGVARAGLATVFPQAIGLAATWDLDLMARVAEAISDEARAKHHDAVRRGVDRTKYLGLTFWSPNVNIFRDPRWGRGQETYGECPYLTSRMGVTFVRGLQADDERYLKLVATPKHYVVHSGPEPERHHFDAQVGQRDLRETYLPAFEACVKEGGAVSLMGAYNRTNGEPCCASPTFLEEILREEWGFEGYVVSDCGAIRDIYKYHQVAHGAAEAAAMAVKAGCDLNCGEVYPALLEAVDRELIDMATIDQALRRLFAARFRLGMFDPPEVVDYAQIPLERNDSPEHRALALEAARKSIVLLKNEDALLPLGKELASIAVLGPNADRLAPLLGNYNGLPSRAISPLDGIREALPPETVLYHGPGCDLAPGVPTLDPIPPTALRPAEGDAGAGGLRAAYFANASLDGEPIATRVEQMVSHQAPTEGPLADIGPNGTSARWSGSLIPPETGTYRLGVRGWAGYYLYLDGKPVIERDVDYRTHFDFVEVNLEAGRVYDLRLEYTHRRLDLPAQIELLWSRPGVDRLSEAVQLAGEADLSVVVLGITPTLEGEEMAVDVEGFRGGDRTEIGLPQPQQELLRRVVEVGKPVVVVLLNGSPLAVNWAAEHVPAIVEAWYPGQAGGRAIADVLFGDYNPGGRLPLPFYKSVDDLPPFEDYAMADRTYRYFSGEPLYAFGHGLSYTEFSYSNLRLSAESIRVGQPLTVSVDVENVGERAGDEVVQMYVSDIAASVPVPQRQLAGFERIHLAPGESRTVTLTLDPRWLSLIDDEGRRVIEPGGFELAVGGRQPGTGDFADGASDVLLATFEVNPKEVDS